MKHIARAIVAIFTLAIISACSTYTGDNLMRLPEQSSTCNQNRTISKAKEGVSDILDSLGVSEEAKTFFKKIIINTILYQEKENIVLIMWFIYFLLC